MKFNIKLLNIFHLLLVSYAHNMMYSEIQRHGGSCFPRDTCSIRRSVDEDNLWNDYTCECGHHCVDRGTCCIDSQYSTCSKKERGSVAETCQNADTTTEYLLMVSTCSKGWQRTSPEFQKCVNQDEGIRDPLGQVPATSIKTGATYKNYFCALCNFDTENLVLWSIAIDGFGKEAFQDLKISQRDFLQNIEFNSSEKSWGILDKGIFKKLFVHFKVPPSLLKVVQPCYPGIISQCLGPYANLNLQRKCLLYYSPIKVRSDNKVQVYRNVHCALCNNDIITDSICPRPTTKRKDKPLSFSLLLDVNQKDGNKVGKVRLCSEDQTYDPFFKKCRSMRCVLAGYVIRNGKCVNA